MPMTTLSELESADVPGVGQRDLTDPGTYVGMVAGVVALLGTVGIANYAFGKLKSASGSEAVKASVPQV